MSSIAHLLGKDDASLVTFESEGRVLKLLPEVLESWQVFCVDARAAGFTPFIVSAYRSFGQQASIWSGKATGQRTVVDDADKPVPMEALTPLEKIEAIMRFSALPGTSRHHWGSDFDIAERSLLPPNYRLQLTPSETEGNGVLAPFYTWLNDYELSGRSAFFRPYNTDRGGVAIEPWHFSHITASKPFERLFSKQQLLEVLANAELPLANEVIANFDMIYDRYIAVG